LLGILAGRLHLGGERCQLMTAPLPDDRERLMVSQQRQRHVVWPARPVTARNGGDAQQGSINAT
jgi:hypothetical protein